jgi:hypothetical protein
MATTSLLIPTRSALLATRYTPAELEANQELEAWFTAPGKPLRIAFLTGLWAAYRNGATTYTHDFGTHTEAAQARVYLVNADYGYIVEDLALIPTPDTSITVNLT